MGKSKAYNLACIIDLCDGRSFKTGADSVKGAFKRAQNLAGGMSVPLVKVTVKAQTAAGWRVMKKDFLIIDSAGYVEHFSNGDNIPAYSF